MTINDFKLEINRAYNVLGEYGEIQNIMDINKWYKDRIITLQEKNELLSYNRKCYFNL